MNDRIAELRKQAMETYTYSDCDGDNNRGTRLNEEKFAELIIQDVIEEFYDEIQYNFSSGYAQEITGSVKKHFGVN
jgi:hypothetical protein